MRAAKINIWLSLGLVFLLVLGFAIMGTGFVYSEEEVSSAEAEIRVIEVDMQNFYFDPEVIKVDPGEEVTFAVRNPSSAFHTFTIYHSPTEREEALVNISMGGNTEEPVEVTVTMPEEEKVLYLVCLPHEGIDMVGQVIVGNPEIEEESTDEK